MTEDVDEFFARCGRAVEATLRELLEKSAIQPSRLREAVEWSLLGGGKRFRPALVLATGQVFGAPEASLLHTAAAVEMVHTYSLVHDDLPAMDDDDVRRGRAACHRKYGEATAILAGDVLQSLAFGAIADDGSLSDQTRTRLISELAIAASRMVEGQQMDLESEGVEIPHADVEEIHRRKTGAMICFSARAGAVIAGASPDELRAVTRYSARLGLLFQITDDILDVTQSAETLGKTAAKDVAAGKATYPKMYGLDGARRMARDTMSDTLGSLEMIDRPAGILRAIAEFVAERRS